MTKPSQALLREKPQFLQNNKFAPFHEIYEQIKIKWTICRHKTWSTYFCYFKFNQEILKVNNLSSLNFIINPSIL